MNCRYMWKFVTWWGNSRCIQDLCNGLINALWNVSLVRNIMQWIMARILLCAAWQCGYRSPWWRHQMETFCALLAICAGNSPVPGEFPAQRPVTRSFEVSFDLRLYKRLSKQSWGWWFETLSRPLWRHRNATIKNDALPDNLRGPFHNMVYMASITLRSKRSGLQIFFKAFSWIKLTDFDSNFADICSQGSINNLRALKEIISWSRQATSHYLNQWWPSLLTQ